MQLSKTFVNRRKGQDRRYEDDPCSEMPVDLFHRKRRKHKERRAKRTLVEDYYAYTGTETRSDRPIDG